MSATWLRRARRVSEHIQGDTMRLLTAFLASAVSLAVHPGLCAAATIADAGVGVRVEVPAFSYGPAKSFVENVTLKRIDVYAPESRILVSDGAGWREIPRSERRVFVSDSSRTATRMYLVYDPKTSRFEGGIFDGDGLNAVAGQVDSVGVPRVASAKLASESAPPFTCGGDLVTGRLEDVAGSLHQPRPASATKATEAGTLYSAIVAIDTDVEFLQNRFAGDPVPTATATDFLVNLFAGFNAIYEGDLGVRLLQGDTLLRTGSDPYATTSASSMGQQLQEFSEYWRANNASIDRAFALQLSGKTTSANSSSGLAWILNAQNGNFAPGTLNPSQYPDGYYDDNWCLAKGSRILSGDTLVQTSGHYSVSRLLLPPYESGTDASGAVLLVGHELGHNFGARHSHCTAADGSSPLTNVSAGTIDACSNSESARGCYGGTTACPGGANAFPGTGSLMSYCSTPCGNVNVAAHFDPAHAGFLETRVASNIAQSCLTAVAAGSELEVFRSGFEPGE